MSENVSERYPWNEIVYERLLKAKRDGTFVAIDLNNFGKVLDVKKIKQPEENYIKVVFKKESPR
ncbi:hypothetical protein KC480_06025 [Bacillus velezensis]|uniref:hypothetical protein n=1 Tax=Bacillus velezensis TaxID=492670 RepID=UPI001E5A35F4|nr:hypothetical protein [Bacillus velezensis]MCD7911083.1 hypothetical protein [Bacillus velezensis]